MNIILVNTEDEYIEVIRLTPEEENFMKDYDTEETVDLSELQRIDMILKDRGKDVCEDLNYIYFLSRDCPIYDEGDDEPVYVIR